MPTEQYMCEQAQPNEMSETRKKLLGDLHAEADELAQKIERLQAFVLEVSANIDYACNTEHYVQACQKQLAFMQEYHKTLCDRLMIVRRGYGENIVKTIAEARQKA